GLAGLLDLAVVGMAFLGLLGEHEVAVDHLLEHTTAGGDQGQLGDVTGAVRQELGRQTDGPVRVVSDHAVFDTDLHGSPFQAGQVSTGIKRVLSPWYRSRPWPPTPTWGRGSEWG